MAQSVAEMQSTAPTWVGSPGRDDRREAPALVIVLLLAGVVGVLVGMVGVGGVLLPPGLVTLGGISPHAATATSTWAFVFTGVVGTLAYSRRGVVPWPMLARLAVGLVPAAFLGARANALLPASVVLLALALLTLLVGLQQLVGSPRAGTPRELRGGPLVVIGAAVGFTCALTGTGGPVLLVPVLLTLGVAPVAAVAVSQAAQLPIVVPASVGYLQAGATDVPLGTLLGLLAGAGTVAGALVAARMHPDRLRQVVALACTAAGAFLVVRTLAGLLG
jgi:uncharacterized protein